MATAEQLAISKIEQKLDDIVARMVTKDDLAQALNAIEGRFTAIERRLDHLESQNQIILELLQGGGRNPSH